MTNMRKKNHLPLFRDDLSTFDDFFQSTKTLSIIRPGRLLVVMTTIVKIVSNVVNTITKAQTSLCQTTATLLIMRPGRPFFLATIMPAIHRIALQVVMIHQAITTHQVALLGAVIHGVVVVLMAVALVAVGKQKKDLRKCASLF